MAHTITELLDDWGRGDETVADELFPRVYDELKRMAAGYLRSQRPDHTLQATALVHEAYCRLVEQRAWGWRNRRHFYAIAAKMMRRILVDHARRRGYAKRGGGLVRVPLDDAPDPVDRHGPDLVALDEALRDLERLDARKTQIVDLRFFVGLTLEETAQVTGLSTATVTRQWLAAKAWLRHQLHGDGGT